MASQTAPSGLTKTLANLTLLAICLILSAAVFLNSASNFLLRTDDTLALRLNPLNNDARLRVLAGSIGLPNFSAEDAQQMAAQGYKFAPSDFRLLTMFGIAEDMRNRPEQAQRIYRQVGQFMPTEFQAVARQFLYLANRNQTKEAAHLAVKLGVRWANAWQFVAPYLPGMINQPEGLQVLADGFGRTDYERQRLIGVLTDNNALSAAYKLIIRWHQSGIEDIEPLVSSLVRRFLVRKEYEAAYFLFRQTIAQKNGASSDYIYNGNFDQPPTNNEFDWRLMPQPGLTLNRVKTLLQDNSGNTQEGYALELRFRNAPVDVQNVRQLTLLSPGRYRLLVDYQTEKLRASKPISLIARCVDGGGSSGGIVLSPAENGVRQSFTEFTVADGCRASRVQLQNDAVKSSWKDRYSGVLRIHRIAIEYLGDA